MLDIKLITANAEDVKKNLSQRNPSYGAMIEEVYALNAGYKKILAAVEELRSKRNDLSKQVGVLRRDKPAEAEKMMARVSAMKEEMAAKEISLEDFKKKIDDLLLNIPNLPDASVPEGKDETSNKEVRRAGRIPQFNFKPLDHHSVGENLGILDFETAATLSGSRFSLLRGDGAKLERAIINYFLDTHAKNGYTEIVPPAVVNENILVGTGQLPKFREDMYALEGDPKQFLISTAEIPLTNLNRGKILPSENLPLKYTACTPCFRKESGAYGKDTRGLIRNHQFDKVELVMISDQKNSFENLEIMTANAEAVLSGLGLAYRVVLLCAGDMGFSSAKTYDIEVWLPSENRYREISSVSNCTDFQARRMNLRYKTADGKPQFVHTLNGSGVAVGRTLAAVLENYQQADGSVVIPPALVPYFGKDKIVK